MGTNVSVPSHLSDGSRAGAHRSDRGGIRARAEVRVRRPNGTPGGALRLDREPPRAPRTQGGAGDVHEHDVARRERDLPQDVWTGGRRVHQESASFPAGDHLPSRIRLVHAKVLRVRGAPDPAPAPAGRRDDPEDHENEILGADHDRVGLARSRVRVLGRADVQGRRNEPFVRDRDGAPRDRRDAGRCDLGRELPSRRFLRAVRCPSFLPGPEIRGDAAGDRDGEREHVLPQP